MNHGEDTTQTQGKEQSRAHPAVLWGAEFWSDHGHDSCGAKDSDQGQIHDLPCLVAVESVKNGRVERAHDQEDNTDIVTPVPLSRDLFKYKKDLVSPRKEKVSEGQLQKKYNLQARNGKRNSESWRKRKDK